MHVQDLRSCGKEFQRFGAAKLNERLPIEDRTSGMIANSYQTNEDCVMVDMLLVDQVSKKVFYSL